MQIMQFSKNTFLSVSGDCEHFWFFTRKTFFKDFFKSQLASGTGSLVVEELTTIQKSDYSM